MLSVVQEKRDNEKAYTYLLIFTKDRKGKPENNGAGCPQGWKRFGSGDSSLSTSLGVPLTTGITLLYVFKKLN